MSAQTTALISRTRYLPAVAQPDAGAAEISRFSRWVPYLAAAGVFLAVRLLSVGMLAAMAAKRDLPLLDRLTAWDGQWYLQLAERGYFGMTGTLDAAGQPFADAPFAFFPLYPALVKAMSLTGMSFTAAGIVVSTLAGIAAACALYRIGLRLGGQRAGLIFVALWAGAPMAITASMVYTEAPFVALAAWALVAVLERQWALAGLACVLAGLMRSTATVLIAVVVVAAVIAVVRGRDRGAALACAIVAPLGLAGFWGVVALQTQSLTGWHDIEARGWNMRSDLGGETVEWIYKTLTGDAGAFQTMGVFVTLAAVALAAVAVVMRIPWPLAAFAVGVVVLAVMTAGFPFMKARFLLPGFVLLLPIALALAKRRTSTAVAATVAFVLFGSWYSAYSLTVWKYGI